MSPRLFYLALGAAAAAVLAIQLSLNLDRHGALGPALLSMSRYFTIWAIALLAILALWVGARRPTEWSGREISCIAAATLFVVCVGAAYHLLLSERHHPTGLWRLTNGALHYGLPLAAAALWLAVAPKGRLRASAPAFWLAFPLLYLGVALWRGAATGGYPYFFLNPAEVGAVGVAGYATALAALFWLTGRAMVGLDAAMARARTTA